MNGHGSGEELEEVVIHDSQKAQRKSKEESRSPAARKYPKGSKQVDALQNRPLLHASSEPTSRLQFFALHHRLFQPHSRESRGWATDDVELTDERLAGEPGTPPPEANDPFLGFGSSISDQAQQLPAVPQVLKGGAIATAGRGLPAGLPPLRVSSSARSADGSSSMHSEPISIPPGGLHTAATSQSNGRSQPSDRASQASDLPDGPELIRPSQEPAASGDASGSGRAPDTASNGLTARQLLGKEEQLRSLVRGQSLNSTSRQSSSSLQSNSIRSSLKGGRMKEAVLTRTPTVVNLADINIEDSETGPKVAGQLPFAEMSAAMKSFAAKDDALPMPQMNVALRDVMSRPRRVSWMEQQARSTPVVDHALAGDLHVGGGPPAVPQSAFRATNSSKTARNQKDKPQNGNFTPRSSDLQFEEEDKDAEKEQAEEEAHKMHWWDFWRHQVFWTRHSPIYLTIICFIVGVSFFIWQRGAVVAYFEVWRWAFFLGCILPIYWISHLVVHCLVVAVESTLFTTKQVLYYTYGVRKPLARFLRVCLVLPIFVACFSGRANDGSGVHSAYVTIVRLLGSADLFFLVFVLKTLLAKLMSTHFHKEAHFRKMQEALQKEYYIMALSQPRADACQLAGKAEGVPEAGRQSSLGAPTAAGEGSRRGSYHHARASAMYDRLRQGLPKMKKTGSLPDLQHAEEAQSKAQAGKAGQATSPPGRQSQEAVPGPSVLKRESAGPQSLPQRTSWQQPMQPFLNRPSVASQAPSIVSRGTQRAAADQKADGARSVASSQRTTSQGPKDSTRTGQKSRFLLRTAAFKKDLPATASVTNLTTALEGVQDASDPKEFNGDLIKKLHVAEKHIRKNKLNVTFADQLGSAVHSDSGEVASKQEAKRLAFYLFWNIKPYFDRNYIVQEDLDYFLPPHKAARAFEILDRDQDGRVSLHDIRDAILQIYKERKDLAFTLKDTKTIVGKLETIIAVVLHIIFVMFYLLIFNVDVSKAWISFSSIVVAFSFIFSTAIQNTFMSVIFLFVVHPYDVGDGIMIGTDLHFVEEISLQNCVLKRWDGARIWYPNTVMIAAPVTNMTRSGCKWESFILYIDVGTPAEVFKILRKRIDEHMEANAGELSGEYACCNFGCGDPLKLKLGVYFEYSHSGTDLGRLNVARHGLAMCICDTLYSLGVTYSMPTFTGPRQPGQAVPSSQAVPADMSRPLMGSQAHTVVQQAAMVDTARNAHAAAINHQFQPASAAQQPDAVHPPFMQRLI